MFPNLFLLSSSGEVLIEKQYIGHVKRTPCELLWEALTRETSKADVPPVVATANHILIHSTKGEITFVTVTDSETPPALVLALQQHIGEVLVEYLTKLTEVTLRDNFSLVYQVLDEVVDGGFPFTTETNQLKEMITPPSVASRVLSVLSSSSSQVRDELASAASSKIPWRRNNIRYSSNDIFFDIIESMDVTLGADGTLVNAQVFGEVRCRCRLSYMPDVTVRFKNSNLLEDASLHRCVRLARFREDKVVSFIPPDGTFTLMTYRVNGALRIPLYVRPEFVWARESCRFSITVGQQGGGGKNELPLSDVVIILPLPRDTQNSQVTANMGNVRVDQVARTCRWELRSLPQDGGALPTLEGTLFFAPNTTIEERPTLRVLFDAPRFTATGVQIETMAVKNVKYTPQRGVRNVSKSGKFQVRTA